MSEFEDLFFFKQKTAYEIAQACTTGQLTKAESKEVIVFADGSGDSGGGKLLDATRELGLEESRNDLREDRALNRHPRTVRRKGEMKTGERKSELIRMHSIQF